MTYRDQLHYRFESKAGLTLRGSLFHPSCAGVRGRVGYRR